MPPAKPAIFGLAGNESGRHRLLALEPSFNHLGRDHPVNGCNALKQAFFVI
jgi:hypothetical protein